MVELLIRHTLDVRYDKSLPHAPQGDAACLLIHVFSPCKEVAVIPEIIVEVHIPAVVRFKVGQRVIAEGSSWELAHDVWQRLEVG